MKFSKNRVIQIVIILLILAAIIIVSATATPTVSNTVTIATAILGFLIILVQLNRDHKIKKAEFIYSLNNSFNSDKDIHEIYMKLKSHRDNQTVEFKDEDGRLMGNYVMFFMIMEYLVKEGLITMKMVDSIFANKFFIFCNNESVYKYQLSEIEINYPILKLYEKWHNFRLKHNLKMLYSKWDLSKIEELFSKDEKGYITLLQKV